MLQWLHTYLAKEHMIISSQHNQHIKQIRSLRHRHERERSGLFFIEGIRIVTDAVQSGAEIEKLVVAPELLKSEFGREIIQEQRDQGTPCTEVTADVFSSISTKDGPQGIGAVVRQRWEELLAAPGSSCWATVPIPMMRPLYAPVWAQSSRSAW